MNSSIHSQLSLKKIINVPHYQDELNSDQAVSRKNRPSTAPCRDSSVGNLPFNGKSKLKSNLSSSKQSARPVNLNMRTLFHPKNRTPGNQVPMPLPDLHGTKIGSYENEKQMKKNRNISSPIKNFEAIAVSTESILTNNNESSAAIEESNEDSLVHSSNGPLSVCIRQESSTLQKSIDRKLYQGVIDNDQWEAEPTSSIYELLPEADEHYTPSYNALEAGDDILSNAEYNTTNTNTLNVNPEQIQHQIEHQHDSSIPIPIASHTNISLDDHRQSPTAIISENNKEIHHRNDSNIHTNNTHDETTRRRISAEEFTKTQKFIYNNMSERDRSALKIGRLIMSTVLTQPDIRTSDSASRFFIDNWLARVGSSSECTDGLNMELLCKFEKVRRDVEARENAQRYSNGYDHDQEHANMSRTRTICSTALESLDKIIEQNGAKNPILHEIRAALLPCIYMPQFASNVNVAVGTDINVADDYLLPLNHIKLQVEGQIEVEDNKDTSKSKIDYSNIGMWCEDSTKILNKLYETETRLNDVVEENMKLNVEVESIEQYKQYINHLENALQEKDTTIVELQDHLEYSESKGNEQKHRVAELMFEYSLAKSKQMRAESVKQTLEEEVRVLHPRVEVLEGELQEAQDLLREREAIAPHSIPLMRPTDLNPSNRTRITADDNEDDANGTGGESNSTIGQRLRNGMSLNLRLQLKELKVENDGLRRRIEELHHIGMEYRRQLDEMKRQEEIGKRQLYEHTTMITSLKEKLDGMKTSNPDTSENYIKFLNEFNQECLAEIQQLRNFKLQQEGLLHEYQGRLRQQVLENDVILQNAESSHQKVIEGMQILHRVAMADKNNEIEELKEEIIDKNRQYQLQLKTVEIIETKLIAMAVRFHSVENEKSPLLERIKELENRLKMCVEDHFFQTNYYLLKSSVSKLYASAADLKANILELNTRCRNQQYTIDQIRKENMYPHATSPAVLVPCYPSSSPSTSPTLSITVPDGVPLSISLGIQQSQSRVEEETAASHHAMDRLLEKSMKSVRELDTVAQAMFKTHVTMSGGENDGGDDGEEWDPDVEDDVVVMATDVSKGNNNGNSSSNAKQNKRQQSSPVAMSKGVKKKTLVRGLSDSSGTGGGGGRVQGSPPSVSISGAGAILPSPQNRQRQQSQTHGGHGQSTKNNNSSIHFPNGGSSGGSFSSSKMDVVQMYRELSQTPDTKRVVNALMKRIEILETVVMSNEDRQSRVFERKSRKLNRQSGRMKFYDSDDDNASDVAMERNGKLSKKLKNIVKNARNDDHIPPVHTADVVDIDKVGVGVGVGDSDGEDGGHVVNATGASLTEARVPSKSISIHLLLHRTYERSEKDNAPMISIDFISTQPSSLSLPSPLPLSTSNLDQNSSIPLSHRHRHGPVVHLRKMNEKLFESLLRHAAQGDGDDLMNALFISGKGQGQTIKTSTIAPKAGRRSEKRFGTAVENTSLSFSLSRATSFKDISFGESMFVSLPSSQIPNNPTFEAR
eukprot:gene7393-15091_t